MGVAVQSARTLGLDGILMTHDPIQKVNVGFINVGDSCVEVIEPASSDSPIINSLKKGIKIVHICYEVDDIQDAIQTAELKKFKAIKQPVPAVAFAGRLIAWVYSPTWGLYELLQREP
ncbi:hypothetical protein AN477_17390 [Alicyclobacillus ferrooxydans]|uniref:VOC domain-containing protein n=1 Tax=Alicyclobacillus ferrooxydans TaxID=471514 RepID=A0A0P9GPC0_9BACL|nr:hypothetical protein AN477_17390 [Alicyclobacillus ferrooxydans]